MTVRIRLTLLFTIALLSTNFWSCQVDEPIENPGQPTPALTGGCDDGATKRFFLKSVPPTFVPDAQLGFKLTTGGFDFSAGDCLCELKQYEIDFTVLPADRNTVHVLDADQNEIEFSIARNLNESYHTIVIPRPARLPYTGMDVYIRFDVPSYANGFVRAGGLCIINNLDGGDPVDFGQIHDKPLKLYYPAGTNSLGQPIPERWEGYIPTIITENP